MSERVEANEESNFLITPSPPLSPWEHTDSLNHKLLQPSRSRRKMIFSFPQQSRYSFTLAQQNSVEYTHGMLFRLRKNMWPFCKIVSSLHVLLFVDAYLRHNTFTEDFWVVPFQYDFLLNFFFGSISQYLHASMPGSSIRGSKSKAWNNSLKISNICLYLIFGR